MQKKHLVVKDHLWPAFPLMLGLTVVILIKVIFVPLTAASIREGKTVYLHFMKKRDAVMFPQREAAIRAENRRIDSVFTSINERKKSRDRSFIDALYSYADTCGFTAGKIEAGLPQPVGSHNETAISISGSGTFRATGSFVEHIENSPHSTRVRQLVIKERGGQQTPEVFIEVVLLEE